MQETQTNTKPRKYKPYKRLTQEKKELIYKLFEEKMELRKIARTLGIHLKTVQYHFLCLHSLWEKKLQEYKELYIEFTNYIKQTSLVFAYMVMDELYTYIGKKSKRYYLWASIAITKTGRKFYFYHLSKYKNAGALFEFNQNLPKDIGKIYCDGCFSYDKIYGNKASMEKSKYTNIIENLNSQLRDKISYLVRRTKAHAKSKDWLDNRLAMFFVNKNING